MLYFDDEKEHLSEVAGTCTGNLVMLVRNDSTVINVYIFQSTT